MCRDHIDVNPEIPQRRHNRRAVATADESNEHDVAAQLPKYAGHVGAFSARLDQNRSRTLNFVCLKMFDLKYAVEGKIGADDKKHL